MLSIGSLELCLRLDADTASAEIVTPDTRLATLLGLDVLRVGQRLASFGISFLIVLLLGSILTLTSLDLHHVFPLCAGIDITLADVAIGTYYEMVLSLRGQGYYFEDYYRAMRDFLNNT